MEGILAKYFSKELRYSPATHFIRYSDHYWQESEPGAQAVAQLSWLEIRKPEPQVLQPLSILVDPGEAEAIALAQTIADSIVLLDDSQARRVAERFHIPRIGTLGILRKAKKQGLIAVIRPHVEYLRANNIYMADKLVEAVLRDVGE